MNLEDMKGAIVLLALIALIGSAAAIALSDFRDDVAADIGSNYLITTTNETVTWTNATYVTLTNMGRAKIVCNTVYNNTENTFLITGITGVTYSCDTNGIIVTDENGTDLGSDVYVTYQYSDGSDAYNSSAKGLDGVANTTGYLGTIGTIIGVAVLIGIVVLAFTFVQR